MKKIALLLILTLAFTLTALASTETIEMVQMQGSVIEIIENEGILIENAEWGEVMVNISEETAIEATHAIAVGDYVYVDYSGQMAYSLPPQISASRICMYRASGEIVEILAEENAVLLNTDMFGEIRVNLPAEWDGQEITAEYMIAYFDGAMTMSIPPQIGAGLAIPGYAIQGKITQIDESSLILGEDMEAIQVNFAPEALAENVNVGDVVRIIYNGQMTRSIPAQVSAIEIIQISR